MESSSSSVDSAEALTYTLCLSSENRAYSEGRTEAGYILFVLRERCFVWLSTGFRKIICFQNASISVLQAAHLAGIQSKTNKRLSLVHSVRVTLRCEELSRTCKMSS